MTTRLAAILGLIAFAACMVVSGFQADNPFSTTVIRAICAMFGTFILGLIVGWAARTMLNDNLRAESEKLKSSLVREKPADRQT